MNSFVSKLMELLKLADSLEFEREKLRDGNPNLPLQDELKFFFSLSDKAERLGVLEALPEFEHSSLSWGRLRKMLIEARNLQSKFEGYNERNCMFLGCNPINQALEPIPFERHETEDWIEECDMRLRVFLNREFHFLSIGFTQFDWLHFAILIKLADKASEHERNGSC